MNLKKILKIFLISGVFIVILCAVFIYIKNRIESITPVGAREIFYMNHIPRYKKLIGQEFETQIDLVILNENRDPEFDLLTAASGMSLPSLEEIKKMKKFPCYYDNFSIILGILTKGSRIKIINVLKTRIIKMGQPHDSYPMLQGKITSEGNFRGKNVLLHNLTDFINWTMDNTDVDTLTILKKFAVRVK